MTMTYYCKLCDSEIGSTVFDCHKCEMTLCPDCIGKAKKTCMGMCDFLCPKCGEVVFVRISLPVEKLPAEVQQQLGQKGLPKHSMGAVVSPAADVRFHPNPRRRRRGGVKRRQVLSLIHI